MTTVQTGTDEAALGAPASRHLAADPAARRVPWRTASSRVPWRRAVALVAAAALATTACTAPDDAPSPGPTGRGAGETTSTPEPVVEPVRVEAEVGGGPLELEVGPLVREGDLGVLHVRMVVPAERADAVSPGVFGFAFWDLQATKPNSFRLFDPATLEVRPVAWAATHDRTVVPAGTVVGPGEEAVLTPVVAAPETGTTAVLVPHVGLVSDVPVVDADDPAAAPFVEQATVASVTEALDLSPEEVDAPVVPATARRELLGGDVRSTEEDGAVDVAIASDVLFAVDSATLSSDADVALEAAAAQLAEHEAGTLEVVGHTDDVDDDAHNQALSERRAQAVADRLATVVDLDGYTVTVTGRGESEPAADGTSSEARRLNRRVELRFTPEAGAEAPAPPQTRTTTAGDLPAPTGPEGAHPQGVVVPLRSGDRRVRITVVELRRVDEVIVGSLDVELLEGAPGAVAEPFTQSAWNTRGDFAASLQFAATGVTLLAGGERVFPLDHTATATTESRYPLADMMLDDEVEVGGSTRVTVVWPDVGAGTVVVDVPPVTLLGGDVGTPWRLTDVPVLSGS